jgi:hypothetical protein
LKEGDVVEQVNGDKMNGEVESLLQKLQSLPKNGQVKFLITRQSGGDFGATEGGVVISPPLPQRKPAPAVNLTKEVIVSEVVQTPPPPPAPSVPPNKPEKKLATPPLPTTNDLVVCVGDKFDVLHRSKMDEKTRLMATDAQPEPPTGWRYRPCEVVQLVSPLEVLVTFLDNRPGYLRDDVVLRSDFLPLNSKSPPQYMHHSYVSDDVLDVLDFFQSKYDGRHMEKWCV